MDAWLPKLYFCLREYNRATFVKDLIAGITVGMVGLPLAMAFAIASGVKPQAGIWCAIITGFLISLLGGSKCQISGPTGAFVVVVYDIIQRHGIDGLYMCTVMAGVMLLLLGITGMGTAVKFFPFPIVLGFTNGIAVLIASTQLRDFFVLKMDKVPGDFLHRLQSVVEHMRTLSPEATLLAVISAALVILFARYVKLIPGSIVALVLGTAAVRFLHLKVETIGTRFGGIPSSLPLFDPPEFRPDLIPVLFPAALTVAMLGAIESLLSAVVADRMSGDKHNPNVELIAQGVGNIVSPLFGGLPATGAIARTATNIRSGAKTPVAGLIHSLTLLVIILVAAPLAKYVPLAVLAGILMVVSYNMGEWREIPGILKLTKADISVWFFTFALTVFADLTLAMQVGMILAALLFIRKVSATTTVSEVTDEYIEDGRVHILQDKKIPDYATVFRIHGPFLFGSTDKLDEIIAKLPTLPPIVILRLRNMTAIDATGLAALEDLADKLHASGRTVILCGAREQPAKLMHQAEFEQHVGRENICPNIQAALARAEEVYRTTPEYRSHPHRRRTDRVLE
jgi:SulP family sulfate permease